MIRMINGSTLINGTLYSASSGPFEAGEATEKRLVALGAAAYTTEKPLTPAESGAPAAGSAGTGNDTPEGTNPTEGRETGESGKTLPAYDTGMKADYLRDLMKQLGIPVKVGMSKGDMVAALDAHFALYRESDEDGEPVEDGEQPPALGAEEPVV